MTTIRIPAGTVGVAGTAAQIAAAQDDIGEFLPAELEPVLPADVGDPGQVHVVILTRRAGAGPLSAGGYVLPAGAVVRETLDGQGRQVAEVMLPAGETVRLPLPAPLPPRRPRARQ